MSASQPVFFLSNTDRKKDFLIETRIWKRADGSLYAEKRASSPGAQGHLDHMTETYASLSALTSLKSALKVVKPVATPQGSLQFDFIGGTSAERILLDRILSEDLEGARDIVSALFAIIESLPSTSLNPADKSSYQKVFGKAFNKEQNCTKLGIIDLNLDNIIIDAEGTWHLYDYEWVFDFPVPKQLLRTRFLWYFFARHREALRYHSQHIDSVKLGEEIYIPRFLHNEYKSELSYIEDLRTAEKGFQQYATGKEGRNLSLMSGELSTVDAGEAIIGIEESLQRAALQQTKKIRSELENEKARRIAAEEHLHRITSSKPYRLARKIVRAKRKITPRSKQN